MRPNASFAILSFGVALLGSGCPATYITVSSDAGAAGSAEGGAGGAAGMHSGGVGGAYAGMSGGAGGAFEDCEYWYPYDSYDYWTCVNGGYGGYGGGAGVSGMGGAGGYGCDPSCDPGCGVGGMGGSGGYGCDPAWDPWCGVGGSAGTGIGGSGGDPCSELADAPSICSCYYGLNNTDYYACLNRHDAQNGGVGGAPATLCEEFAPWSEEHERCVTYYQNGNAGSYAGEPLDPDAGSPE